MHLSNLPPGVSPMNIDRAATDPREALKDAVYAALRRHLSADSADEVWAILDVALDDADDADDVERAIERRFEPEDARCGDVLAEVRPVAERLLD